MTQLEAAYETAPTTGGSWFEDALTYDNARLSQALIIGGTALDRDDAVDAGLSSLAWLGDECGLAEGFLRLPGNKGAAPHANRRRVPATSSRSTRPRSSRPSSRRSRSPATPCTARARSARSTGSSAATGSAGRSTTSRPAVAATVSASTDVNTNEGAESTLAFHRAQLVLDAAGLPRVLRIADATTA